MGDILREIAKINISVTDSNAKIAVNSANVLKNTLDITELRSNSEIIEAKLDSAEISTKVEITSLRTEIAHTAGRVANLENLSGGGTSIGSAELCILPQISTMRQIAIYFKHYQQDISLHSARQRIVTRSGILRITIIDTNSYINGEKIDYEKIADALHPCWFDTIAVWSSPDKQRNSITVKLKAVSTGSPETVARRIIENRKDLKGKLAISYNMNSADMITNTLVDWVNKGILLDFNITRAGKYTISINVAKVKVTRKNGIPDWETIRKERDTAPFCVIDCPFQWALLPNPTAFDLCYLALGSHFPYEGQIYPVPAGSKFSVFHGNMKNVTLPEIQKKSAFLADTNHASNLSFFHLV